MTQALVHERPKEISSDSPKHVAVKYWVLLIFAVLVAFGPLVLTNQSFWDDWVLIAHAKAGTLGELFKQAGRREQFLLMAPFAFEGGARACTIVALALSCALGPLIYTIIRRAARWPAEDAFWAALLTVLVPLNQARFFLSTKPYIFSCAFFASALVLLLYDLDRSNIVRRVLTVLLLVMAFSTNSFLVLSWIPVAIVAAAARRSSLRQAPLRQQAAGVIRAVLARAELLLAPPAYWLMKLTFEPTSGMYANYNKFRMGIPTALKQTALTLFSQFQNAGDALIPPRLELVQLTIAAIAIAALFIAAVHVWKVPIETRDTAEKNSGFGLRYLTLLVAFALLVSALFPYVIVGEPPRYNGLWETRHQTTLMLVSGFAIFASMRVIVPRKLLWKVAALLAVSFLTIDIWTTHRLVVDALETGEIAAQFRQHPPDPGNMMFVIEADRDYRAFGRYFPFYELSFLANVGQTGIPAMALSNREILDPSTGTYPTTMIPTAIKRLVELCKSNRSKPQFGFGGFISNGRIETVKLIADRPPPGIFRAIYEAAHSSASVGSAEKSATMVKMERHESPIGGACVSPCCSDQ